MANNPNVNKVIYGNQTVMDITDTTAEEGDVVSGKTFYKASGARSTGSAVIPDISNCYQTTDTAETTIADNDYFPFYDTSATAKRKTLWSTIAAKIKALVDPVRVTLTKQQYDALSSTEKNNPDKVYYVTDYDAAKTYVKLDDSSTSLDKVWSSSKVSGELSTVATSSTLGRVKIGSNMSISNAVINPSNITYGTSALTSGSSSLATGRIYCQYE